MKKVYSICSIMKKYYLICLMVVIWLIAFIISSYMMLSIGETENKTNDCSINSPCELNELKIYNQSRKGYVKWERKEAIAFGLDKIDTTINYLFIGVAGIFAFIGKIFIEPKIKNENTQNITAGKLFWIVNSTIACVFSVSSGFFARLYFNNIGDIESFSIYDELGRGLLLQLVFFVAAFGCVAIASYSIIKK